MIDLYVCNWFYWLFRVDFKDRFGLFGNNILYIRYEIVSILRKYSCKDLVGVYLIRLVC